MSVGVKREIEKSVESGRAGWGEIERIEKQQHKKTSPAHSLCCDVLTPLSKRIGDDNNNEKNNVLFVITQIIE